MGNPYQGDFSSWADVYSNFGGNCPEKEPTEVIHASYDHEGYEGSAHICYRQGRKYYTVYGNHCSCYGLEGQWDPVEYPTKKLLVAALEKGWWDHKEELLKLLKGLT